MKIITEPTVTLLAWPQFQEHPKYKLPAKREPIAYREGIEHAHIREIQGTHSERLIAHAGKGCYDSYGEDGRPIGDHIATLVGSGHGSVLEHANISLFLEGISRGCSHEIVRHRAGFAFSQRSTRYTAEDDAAIVLDPYFADLHIRANSGGALPYAQSYLLTEFITSCEHAFASYKSCVHQLAEFAPELMRPTEKRKWARGKARQLLPHALETRMTMTGNLRAWWHFLVSRSNRHAEAEIRRLAAAIYATISPLAPTVFNWSSDPVDGYPEFTPLPSKV